MSDEEEETTEDAKKEAEEAEIVTGLLTFHVGDREVAVPELKWRADREWQQKYLAVQARLSQPDAPDVLSEAGVQALEDAQLELVLAYDQTHALGDLEDATRRQIGAIYERLVKVSWLPLAESLTTLIVAIVRRAVEEAIKSHQESSTSGPSLTGTSAAPTILKGHSRTARSSSSTRKRRSE